MDHRVLIDEVEGDAAAVDGPARIHVPCAMNFVQTGIQRHRSIRHPVEVDRPAKHTGVQGHGCIVEIDPPVDPGGEDGRAAAGIVVEVVVGVGNAAAVIGAHCRQPAGEGIADGRTAGDGRRRDATVLGDVGSLDADALGVQRRIEHRRRILRRQDMDFAGCGIDLGAGIDQQRLTIQLTEEQNTDRRRRLLAGTGRRVHRQGKRRHFERRQE